MEGQSGSDEHSFLRAPYMVTSHYIGHKNKENTLSEFPDGRQSQNCRIDSKIMLITRVLNVLHQCPKIILSYIYIAQIHTCSIENFHSINDNVNPDIISIYMSI